MKNNIKYIFITFLLILWFTTNTFAQKTWNVSYKQRQWIGGTFAVGGVLVYLDGIRKYEPRVYTQMITGVLISTTGALIQTIDTESESRFGFTYTTDPNPNTNYLDHRWNVYWHYHNWEINLNYQNLFKNRFETIDMGFNYYFWNKWINIGTGLHAGVDIGGFAAGVQFKEKKYFLNDRLAFTLEQKILSNIFGLYYENRTGLMFDF